MVEFLERTWWVGAILLFVTFLSVLGVASREGETANVRPAAQVAASKAVQEPPRAKRKPSAPQPAESDDAEQAEGDEALIDSATGEDTTPAEDRAAAAAAAEAPALAAPASAVVATPPGL